MDSSDENQAESFVLRPLCTHEEDAGYAVILDAVEWLREHGIRMWERPLPRPVYAARQERGQNFGLFVQGELAVIASIVSAPPDWAHRIPEAGAPWLSTLATARAFRGQNWGRRMVQVICALVAARGDAPLYLDCGPGFLEAYYGSLGFVPIESRRRLIERPPHLPYECECTLMRKDLGDNIP